MESVLAFLTRTDVYVGIVVLILFPVFATKAAHGIVDLRRKARGTRTTYEKEQEREPIGDLLKENKKKIDDRIGMNADITTRNFKLGEDGPSSALIHIDGLVNVEEINNFVLKPLMSDGAGKRKHWRKDALKQHLIDHVISVAGIKEVEDIESGIKGVMTGSALLLVDGVEVGIVLDVKGWKSRAIEEPPTEALVRGPRIGFIENIRDNTSILRRLTNDPNLTILNFEIGDRSKKDLAIVYIKDIANEELLQEVIQRVKNIDIDDALESGYIEQLIEDNYLSIFPQVQATERPDRVMGGLLEGRISILLDGTPYALIVPATFAMMIQSPEDYYERWIPMSLIRMLRYFAAILSIFLPSFYVAFISFHQGMIPTELALAIASTRIGVPFPTIIEALLMELAIEMLREAGLRLPRPVGQTIGLVGAIIIGEAAVQAGLVSPIMVIVVATTAIASFVSPQYGMGVALRVLRFVAMFFAAFLGLYGIILFFLLLCIHVVKLRSFGVPYVTPATIYNWSDLKDFIFRLPLFVMKQRPKEFFPKERTRRKF
ncbi:spore germination protein [Bacillus sp. SB49]|uniref:spore germination protein n=1 Tax=Bacillus sp. SB49 TaxID=1071080 RepID=UPI0004138305|nr:spore germination protein [Bacillus sp. SB49]